MNKILIKTKSVYGKTNYYVVSEHKDAIASLLGGQKTVTKANMRALAALGFEFELVQDEALVF